MFRSSALRFALLMLCAAGCQSAPPQPERPATLLVEYPTRGEAETRDAPGDGTYALYETAGAREYRPGDAVPEPAGKESPKLRGMVLVPRHGRVGFERDGAGRLVAVAERERVVLIEGNYAWHRTGDVKCDPEPERPLTTEKVLVAMLFSPLAILVVPLWWLSILGGGGWFG